MRDGLTEKKPAPAPVEGLETFLAEKRAKLVVLSGERMGTEFALEQESVILGRGPNENSDPGTIEQIPQQHSTNGEVAMSARS